MSDVLVGADTGGFERFGGELLVLVRDHVYAQGELVDVGTLAAEIEDSDLRVWYTTVEAGFRVRLQMRSVSRSYMQTSEDSFGVVDGNPADQSHHADAASSFSSSHIRYCTSNVPCSCSNGNISLDDGPWRIFVGIVIVALPANLC